ncbi:hypothetical protein A9G11_04030 [Gilliamella sp. wkB108]|uniref:protein YgfX n=1 Tax=Gilliamella sp. wkB108 TaxID=3120256 RepID=UPI00080E7EE1|nr:protein YgfX [Gilliamella apicola]OCG24253.1 hypothetical protein A9G11_04030 [Gilliamella apicola]
MWSTTLTISYQQVMMLCVFYLVLIILSWILLADTSLNCYTFIIILLLVIEWWRSISYCRTIKGELALFHYIHQIYWHKQRWYLMQKPLLLRYMIILNLKSRRNGKRHTLFLMIDSICPCDWRTLHYYLRQIDLTETYP